MKQSQPFSGLHFPQHWTTSTPVPVKRGSKQSKNDYISHSAADLNINIILLRETHIMIHQVHQDCILMDLN